MAKKFIIQDWAGNRMFPSESFATFDDGWEFIDANVVNSKFDETQDDNDNAHQDIYVLVA